MNDLEFFKGFADVSRLRTLNLLLHGELCDYDVLDTSQPNLSRDLQYLKNFGLVLDRGDRYRIYYRLAEPVVGLRKQLFEFLQVAFKN